MVAPDALSPPICSASVDPRFCLLYIDDALLVVGKPAGLLAVPGRGLTGADNLVTRVQQAHPEACAVHRLDMATSGLMLLARGPDMQRALSRSFEQRTVHKRYEAVVHGLVHNDTGCIDTPLAADWPRRPRQKVDFDAGKPSLTRWQVLDRDAAGQRTRLRLEPVTGRTHQLRVHLMSLGHTIVGDALYGSDATPATRLLLHAYELRFTHPVNGSDCHFTSAAPF